MIAHPNYEEQEILSAFRYVGKEFVYNRVYIPGCYIVDGEEMGYGYVNWRISLNEKWFVVIATFITPGMQTFRKTLLLYHDEKLNQLNRCHAIYCDEKDLKKNGGTHLMYSTGEILASLINHFMTNDKSTCIGCAGKHPLQTHYIQLLKSSKVKK